MKPMTCLCPAMSSGLAPPLIVASFCLGLFKLVWGSSGRNYGNRTIIRSYLLLRLINTYKSTAWCWICAVMYMYVQQMLLVSHNIMSLWWMKQPMHGLLYLEPNTCVYMQLHMQLGMAVLILYNTIQMFNCIVLYGMRTAMPNCIYNCIYTQMFVSRYSRPWAVSSNTN